VNDDANDHVSGTAPGNTGQENRDNPPREFRRPFSSPARASSRDASLAQSAGRPRGHLWARNHGRPHLGARQQPARRAAQELFNTANKTTADGLAALPKDYTGIPQLGPALPGDLGRPMLNAHSAVLPDSGFNSAEQRLAQESEAARTSQLFSTTSSRERPETGPALAAAAPSNVAMAASLLADQKAAA